MTFQTPQALSQRLTELRADGSEAALDEATRIEREAEKQREKQETKRAPDGSSSRGGTTGGTQEPKRTGKRSGGSKQKGGG